MSKTLAIWEFLIILPDLFFMDVRPAMKTDLFFAACSEPRFVCPLHSA